MILGICGSPRKKATEYVLREALSKLEEAGFETVFLQSEEKKSDFVCIVITV